MFENCFLLTCVSSDGVLAGNAYCLGLYFQRGIWLIVLQTLVLLLFYTSLESILTWHYTLYYRILRYLFSSLLPLYILWSHVKVCVLPNYYTSPNHCLKTACGLCLEVPHLRLSSSVSKFIIESHLLSHMLQGNSLWAVTEYFRLCCPYWAFCYWI